MKYKVVGWTDYDYNGFKEMPSFNMHAYMTLVREIREKVDIELEVFMQNHELAHL